MTEHLSSADVAFLHREQRTAPQHVGGLALFEPPSGGFDYERLVRLLEERISLAPRYRQRVRGVPAGLANPVWVDDARFDITYHVRRSALPRPGTERQLLDLCARIQARMLDRSRPLWEMYLVDGLADGRMAIITKTHQAMVDESGAVDLFEVVLDASPEPRRTVQAVWMPRPEPSSFELVRSAVATLALSPAAALDAARSAVRDSRTAVERASRRAGGLQHVVRGIAWVSRSVLQPQQRSPLQARLGEERTISIARTRLEDYRRVRDAYGGTVNDVVLAAVAGALRGWLLARAVPLRPASTVRALVPVSVSDPGDGASPAMLAHPAYGDGPHGSGSHSAQRWSADGDAQRHVRPLLVDLPVGEPDPTLRLSQLRYAMASHQASGRAVGADALAALGGFAPPTLLALGARTTGGLTRRMFGLIVSNVPGPQVPLYAAGVRMREMFPIMPVSVGQAMSVALTSYDGGVYLCVNGDRDAVPDGDMLALLVEESLAELLATLTPAASVAGESTPRRGGSGAARRRRRPGEATSTLSPPPDGPA